MLVVLGDCSSLGAVLTAMKGNNEELKTTIETVVRRGARTIHNNRRLLSTTKRTKEIKDLKTQRKGTL